MVPTAQSLTHKLIKKHLVEGRMVPGEEIAIRMDQALLQDATGTLAWLEFEQMGVDRVRGKRATQYVDHNILQTGFENADDHLFLQGMCARYGAVFSRPGNGISHWSHMERFDVPGQTMIGCDSHTCQAGATGMLALMGVSVEAALAATLLLRVFTLWLPLVPGFVLIRTALRAKTASLPR